MIGSHSVKIAVELVIFSIFINDLFLCNKEAIEIKILALSTYYFYGSQHQVISNLFNDCDVAQKLLLSDNLMQYSKECYFILQGLPYNDIVIGFILLWN